ncbi:hypothetical protein ACFLQ0_02670 [Nitrospinota bacterium]
MNSEGSSKWLQLSFVNFLSSLFLAVVLFPNAAESEIYVCRSTFVHTLDKGLDNPPVHTLTYKIVTPEKSEDLLGSFPASSEGNFQPVSIGPIGVGTIEVKYHIGTYKYKRQRHKFVQLRTMTYKGNALIGFYVNQGFITVIRADLWAKGKPFFVHDTWLEYARTFKGNCD